MKVSYNKDKPQISLSGNKLKDSGFEPGDAIEAVFENGCIIIKLKEKFVNERQLELINEDQTIKTK